MTNVTLAVPEELHGKMKEHSEIRWSEVIRRTISEKIADLEKVERIARKSKLTEADVEAIARKIKADMVKDMKQ